ncbi:MAG TPA: hypothetical protein VFI37_00245 [Gaiellaceae bacterium]|nr:hypothetical protein [Gaiellaceae bacterium]
MRATAKLGLVTLAVAVGCALIFFYIARYIVGGPNTFTPAADAATGKVVDLKIETVAAVGPQLSSHPDWVSYLVQSPQGTWERRTTWKLPAHATVHVTIYNFDGASGLRNPIFSRPQGVDGNVMVVDGKTLDSLPPDDASHTFAVPALGIVIPVAPVGDDAKNPCDYAPCGMDRAHRTITFTFHTGAPGHYRWQCFVPCAAGWVDGFGGPMQTIGYMDGFLDVA